MTRIPFAVGATGMVSKGLEKRLEKLEIRGRIETFQTKTAFNLTRIPKKKKKSWRSEESCCSSDRSENYQLKLVLK